MDQNAQQDPGEEPRPTPGANPSASNSTRQLALWMLLVFGGPWLIYALFLWRQPPDPFVAWHGDVAWPAQHFLAHSQGGLVLPIFAHLMVGTIGGLFVSVVVAGVLRLIVRLGAPNDFGGSIATVFLFIVPMWAFVFVKAVPQTVTVIDRDARKIEIHNFQLVLRYPTGVETIAENNLRAFDLSSHWSRRAGERFLRLHAHTRDGRVVELAERACDSADESKCLAEGDEDILRLAEWLGHPGGHIESNTKSLRHGVSLAE